MFASNFEVLSERDCRRLLAQHNVGRVAFDGAAGYPVVLPVNYVTDGDLIAFKTSPGEKLESIPAQPVAFQVDGFDRSTRTGWSVLAQGIGLDITQAAGAQYERLRGRAVSTWAPGAKSDWLAIDVRYITGRRIVSAGDPTCSWFDADDGPPGVA
jgi:nitroimidazol reductase NimA-like FMN-containing flavoprotein (pyridoxamine 5'-phosphate oxidase superfamily)